MVQPEKLPVNALVCITEHITSKQAFGPALAVGRMVVDGRRIIQEDLKTGKAAVVLHIVGDKLWEMGSRPTKLPDPMDMTMTSPSKEVPVDNGSEKAATAQAGKAEDGDGDDIEDVAENATEPPESEDDGDGEQGTIESAKVVAESNVTSPAAIEPDIKLTPDGAF